MEGIIYSVFTKPWRELSLDALGELVADMGFGAIEYPLRTGYQIQPSDGSAGIVTLCKTLAKSGVSVASIAAGIDVHIEDGNGKAVGIDENLFAGCGEAGVPIIRICQSLKKGVYFHDNITDIRRIYDAILPYCERYNVTLGVQMHFGHDISNSAETYILLRDYDPKYIAAVWDSGHSGLAGNIPRLALDTVWDMLCMVNFKAAYWRRVKGPEQEQAEWDAYWTTARHGQGSWKEAVDYLKERGYTGTVCLPAEYSDEQNVEAYAREDLAYIKSLFKGGM